MKRCGMDYPVKLQRDDNDTILVSFPDFPEAHTCGDDVEEAAERFFPVIGSDRETLCPFLALSEHRDRA
jgi:hypothetical protein